MKQYRDTPYSVDKDGNVWRYGRKLTLINNHHRLLVNLSFDGLRQRTSVARMVAECFLPNSNPEKDLVSFIDGDCTNVAASNLYWATRGEINNARAAVPNQKRVRSPDGIVFVSINKAAAYAEVSKTTIRKWCNLGLYGFGWAA